MTRLIAHPRVLTTMLDDYGWFVANGYLEDRPAAWPAYVEGYRDAKTIMARRGWRRSSDGRKRS